MQQEKCNCGYEKGHSFVCPLYKEPKNPMQQEKIKESWEDEFDKLCPSVEEWSQRNGDYTETPIPHIKHLS